MVPADPTMTHSGSTQPHSGDSLRPIPQPLGRTARAQLPPRTPDENALRNGAIPPGVPRKAWTALLVVIALAALAVFFAWPRGVKIVLANCSQRHMTSASVSYRGGSIRWPMVPAAGCVSGRARLEGGSGLTLDFTVAELGTREESLDLYITGRSRGTVIITVTPCLDVLYATEFRRY